MTESQAPNGGVPNPGAAGIPFYEKTRQELKSLIARKKLLEKKLAAEEELIYEKETESSRTHPAETSSSASITIPKALPVRRRSGGRRD